MVGLALRICISNKFLDDADDAGPGTTLGRSVVLDQCHPPEVPRVAAISLPGSLSGMQIKVPYYKLYDKMSFYDEEKDWMMMLIKEL